MTALRDYVAGLAQPTLAGGAEPARYDEVVAPDGGLRAAWKGLAELAVGLTPADLARVDRDIARVLEDDGVTYAPPGRRTEPWRLDPVPLIVDAAGWAPLEVGLAQRAELLNAVLVDLYGEQRLLRERIVPAAVVRGHPGFVRVVAREGAVDRRPLVFAAADLGRDAQGRWRVLADRAQAPSGLGYAMENRRVVSRVMPELYREAGLHRMEPYFWAMRSALLQSANGDLADPRVVVLSPGTHSETAYDQAFIASILGFPLVQGSDLVVRDGWVHLRVPGRLERVDVILRRVDAAWSDPLELRGESQLGVVGLTEAVRRGRVRVVNGLGAGVLESPGLLPYLPAACEALLGEPLRLPSVDTWWCGEPDGLEQVLDRLPELSVRPIDGAADALRGLGREELTARLLAAPHRYVGQERLPLSQAPTWERTAPGRGRGAGGAGGRVRPRSLTLRAFTLRYGSSYRPLVGGLATVHGEDLHDPVGRTTKDVWVLKGTPGEPDQNLAEVLATTSARSVSVTVPRILEDMFWFGRYAERAEDLVRLVLTTHAVAEDYKTRPGTTGAVSLGVLLGASARLAGRRHEDDVDAEFRSLLLDGERSGSLAHALGGMWEALAGVRDQLSPDIWRVFGATDRAADALRADPHSHQIAESAGRALTGILSLQGVTASMMRDPGWHMIGAGRSIERALQVCHLLRATVTERRGLDVDRTVLGCVLQAAESAVTHRRRYRGYVRPASVFELLVLDADNPRSLAFSLGEVAAHLAALPASTGSSRPERLVADLLEQVRAQDVATLVAIGGVGRPNLEAFLERMTASVARLSDAIAEVHFASGPAPRLLGAATLVPGDPGRPEGPELVPARAEDAADAAVAGDEGAAAAERPDDPEGEAR
ncbi:circularly permuted type 2 ATP-grasp protein [Nocardioides sp. TRM66260-LWL]|uniref:circularly permuted type 2 ATP-grasp protein n=1 Tax=Nocardioides sp. TRM66260-LWL TaxID=2874478 RepID=UPI001CC6433E|nr:circularly permuted type 2 ATP-grasp protein [Nocardioides sp. TRM66260-LWL]MBZ5735980.1 circularly permuted type 2 ATP-grasp protein [Nocardioides sp. TRM66260-LWL]